MATRSLWIWAAFKPFRLRYVTVDCWSSKTTDLNGSVSTSGEVQIDVMLVVCWRMVIETDRILYHLSPSYLRVAWD
jgi:hypothetical protein